MYLNKHGMYIIGNLGFVSGTVAIAAGAYLALLRIDVDVGITMIGSGLAGGWASVRFLERRGL
jgi:hypothetical protein